MSKIGKKIMQSYFIIILATAFVFMGISKMSFNDILNRQTRLDLKKDADVVAKQINMVIDQKIEMTVVDGSPNVKIQISKNFLEKMHLAFQKLFSQKAWVMLIIDLQRLIL